MYAPPITNGIGAYLRKNKPQLIDKIQNVESEKDLIQAINGKPKTVLINIVDYIRHSYKSQQCQVLWYSQ